MSEKRFEKAYNERLKANNNEQFIKLLIEMWFMKQLEKKYFPEDD